MPQSSSKFTYIHPHSQVTTTNRLSHLSRLLDKVITIPGTPIAIGLDPIIGCIPVGGDIVGLLISSYILMEAKRLGVSKKTLRKMIFNIIIDTFIGSFPVLGDLFDFMWTANEYNIKLLKEHLNDQDLGIKSK